MCTDGPNCRRRVCFFAHLDAELRTPEEDPVWAAEQLQQELAQELALQSSGQARAPHARQAPPPPALAPSSSPLRPPPRRRRQLCAAADAPPRARADP